MSWLGVGTSWVWVIRQSPPGVVVLAVVSGAFGESVLADIGYWSGRELFCQLFADAFVFRECILQLGKGSARGPGAKLVWVSNALCVLGID